MTQAEMEATVNTIDTKVAYVKHIVETTNDDWVAEQGQELVDIYEEAREAGKMSTTEAKYLLEDMLSFIEDYK